MDEQRAKQQRALDAALIASVIILAPFCRPCIEKRTGLTGVRLRALRVWAHPYIGLTVRRTRCEACAEVKQTYQIG